MLAKILSFFKPKKKKFEITEEMISSIERFLPEDSDFRDKMLGNELSDEEKISEFRHMLAVTSRMIPHKYSEDFKTRRPLSLRVKF